MKELLNSTQMKACDAYTIEELGVPSLVLMERAALSVVQEITKDYLPKEISAVIFTGTGNNGGDGIAIGRILAEKGAGVLIVTVGDPEKYSEEMGQQLVIAKKMGILIKTYDDSLDGEYNVIVDALFGIGLTRTVQGTFQRAIQWINQKKNTERVSVYAVDIPSGIHTDTGEVLGCAVQADKTITFQYAKPGLYLGEALEYAGEVIVTEIGISALPIKQGIIVPEWFCYEPNDVKKLPPRKLNGHKGTFGRVLVIAGAKNMAGAAMFSAESAYRMGCGLVEVFTAEENRVIVQSRIPEAVLTTYDSIEDSMKKLKYSIEKADVIVLGPGLSMSAQAQAIVEYTIKNATKPCIVDADAINILANHLKWLENIKFPCILTPHVKELARLSHKETITVKKQLFLVAKEIAKRYECIVVAKDAKTIVVEKERTSNYLNLSGCSGMATGGSGDVLAGIIAGLLAQNVSNYEGVCLGVYIHGLAGEAAQKELGGYSMTARDIIQNLHHILR